MSQPPPQVVAAQEVEEATSTEKKRKTNCSQDYSGTVWSFFFTVLLLLWVFTLIFRIVANAAQDLECEGLLEEDPINEAVFAMVAIMFLLCLYFTISIPFGNWLASLGLLLGLVASFSAFSGFPNLEDNATFGIFHSSSPLVRNNTYNNSEYWNNNIRTCVCRTGACEDMVYRKYFIKINRLEDFNPSGYSKLPLKDETEGLRSPAAKDLKGTSLKKGEKEVLTDRPGLSSDSQHHEVCYSKKIGYDYKGNRTLCYDCYACEEEFLIHEQRTRWKLGNTLYFNNLLLISVNLIVFLAESWARYME